VRIIAAARAYRASPVLAASAADADSPAARLADEVIVNRSGAGRQSYLRPELIATAALQAGASVVHPGLRILSEQRRVGRLLGIEKIAFAGLDQRRCEPVGDKSSATKSCVGGRRARLLRPWKSTMLKPSRALGDSIGYPAADQSQSSGAVARHPSGERPQGNWPGCPSGAAEALAAFATVRSISSASIQLLGHVEVQVFGDGEGRAQIFGIGLLGAAATPETHRGVPRARALRGDPSRDARRLARPRPSAAYAEPARLSSSSIPSQRRWCSLRSTPASRSNTRSPRRPTASSGGRSTAPGTRVGPRTFPTFLRSPRHGHRLRINAKSRERFPAQPRHD